MKNHIYILLIIGVQFLPACTSTSNTTIKKYEHTWIENCTCVESEDAGYHNIDYSLALQYMRNFLLEPNLKLCGQIGFRGYIDGDYLGGVKLLTTDNVIRFHPSYDVTTNKAEVAVEHDVNYDRNNPDCNIEHANIDLMEPMEPYPLDYGVDDVSLNQFVTRRSSVIPISSQTSTPKASIENLQTAFQHKYTDINNNVLNILPCGAFFRNELCCLLNQKDPSGKQMDIRGIHYYMGYDNRKQNKLRLILIAVYWDGHNYADLVEFPSSLTQAKIMEHAWPPN